MKNRYTEADCRHLADLFVHRVKELASNGEPNYLLLSGGMDSVTVLYALIKAGIHFKAFTFYFKGYPSVDQKAVELLQSKLGFEHEFIEIPSDWSTIESDVCKAIKACKELYGRVREVKVETIFALQYMNKYIPSGGNIFTGSEGDALVGYNRQMAMKCYSIGDSHPDMLSDRILNEEDNEFRKVFNANHKYAPVFEGAVTDFILGFTMAACNSPKPKAIFYHAFAEYHRKYQSYRQPKAFQKAGNEKAMFNMIAQSKGFKNALSMFNSMSTEMKV